MLGMKNLISKIIFVAGTVWVGNLRAQEYHHPKIEDSRTEVHMGFKLGANISSIYDELGNQMMADPKFGMMGGAWLALPVGPALGLQPELLYSQKGYMARGSILNLDYSYTQSADYLDLPIFLQIKPAPAVSLLLGPQYSWLLFKSDKFGSGEISEEQKNEIRRNSVIKNVWSAATGVDINLRHLSISARCCWDLKDNKADGTSIDPIYKNMWLQSGVGYRF